MNLIKPRIIKPLTENTDAELLLEWRGGNEMAFEAIYHRYVLKLLAIAIDKTRDPDLAEELVQDTFLALYNSKIDSEKLNTLMAFLYVILKNKIMDRYRRLSADQKFKQYYSRQYSEADYSTQALIETRELERLLAEEIEKLPPQCRKVFILKRHEMMSNKDVARELQISENTVEQHMRKALKTLRGSFLKHDLLLLGIMLSNSINHLK